MVVTAIVSGVTKSTNSRTARALALLAALALVATSCGADDAATLEGPAADIYAGTCADATDTTITVYSGRSEELVGPVFDAFTCETGHAIAPRWGGSTDMALLLGEEGERSAADVFLSRSPGPVGFLEGKGLLAPLDADLLDLVDSSFASDEGTWVGFSGRQRVAVYSTDTVEPGELPASVFDLTGEAWRDRVAIPATNGSFADWFTVLREQFGNDAAATWLNDMVANGARSYPNNRSIVEAAGRGEIDLGLVNHYYNYQEAAALGDSHRAANHGFANNDIGALLMVSAASITSSSNNVEASTQLLTYLLSEPVQQYFTTTTFEYPIAAGVDAIDGLAPLDAAAFGSIDFNSLGGGFEETNAIIEASGILNQ